MLIRPHLYVRILHDGELGIVAVTPVGRAITLNILPGPAHNLRVRRNDAGLHEWDFFHVNADIGIPSEHERLTSVNQEQVREKIICFSAGDDPYNREVTLNVRWKQGARPG
jgi:hypothetical protein